MYDGQIHKYNFQKLKYGEDSGFVEMADHGCHINNLPTMQ
jgi:hypothetical protein